jgi:hypothetical protein
MKVALLFNEKPALADADLPDDTYEEYDDPATVCHIADGPAAAGRDG